MSPRQVQLNRNFPALYFRRLKKMRGAILHPTFSLKHVKIKAQKQIILEYVNGYT